MKHPISTESVGEDNISELQVNGSDSYNDVAIVGMGCRLAGNNNSVEELWETIIQKSDASGEIPSLRWEPYWKRDVRNAKCLRQTTNRGYFLDHLEDFDAAFFGISPTEAEQMDPQQRLALEVTWEALENAGIPPHSLSGSDTAVFMGVNSDDYSKLLLEDLPGVEAWMGIGTAYCGVPNRISYILNLMGPSTAVDAACASSLVAIHHGRQAILQGESKIAIVGGVNAMCGPGLTSVLDKAGAISPDGRCRSFDDAANGYGRGEGAAVVVLKDMASAIHDGDNIISVLKGSAVAQDGRTNGIMAPNAKTQELVALKALQQARIDPSTVDYVEAHATSTPLGDPTEVQAISRVYGSDAGRTAENPCFIGSVKPNVGHLEAGAGVVGFIKAAMSVQRGLLLPQTNLATLNSKINWSETGVRVVQETQSWPAREHRRRAGVCSYGYGGTVAHAIIEQYVEPEISTNITSQAAQGPQVLLLSAPQEKRLATQAVVLESWISTIGKEQSLDSIVKTLAIRRGHHEYRAAFVVDDHNDAAGKMDSFAKNNSGEWTAARRVIGRDSTDVKRVVWVFSGHGAQWPEMAKNLLLDPVFYNTVASLDPIIQTELGFSALKAMETGDFEASDQIQVLTYLMQIGLSAILHSKGLTCEYVLGHSVGEIAASVVAGCITPVEGAFIVAKRAKLYRQFMGLGAMLLVNAPISQVEEGFPDQSSLVVAIDSSMSSCVISGLKEEVEAFHDSLKARGIQSFRVKSDVAFHHPMLDILCEPLAQALKGCSLSPQPAKVGVYSTSAEDPRTLILRDVEYWTNNMTKPVLLRSAVAAAIEDGAQLFLEVSTHPIVSQSIIETLMDKGVEEYVVTNTMARQKQVQKTIPYCMAQLHCGGAFVSWLKDSNNPWATGVPNTTWSHKPVWRRTETQPLTGRTIHDVDQHTLLGQRITVAGERIVLYKTAIDENTKPFPGSHPLFGAEIVPAAVLINTFLQGTGTRTLHDVKLHVPVSIAAPRDIQVVVQKGQVELFSRLVQESKTDGDCEWLIHTSGRWDATVEENVMPAQVDIGAAISRIGTKLPDNFSVDYLDRVGVSAMGFPWAITEHYGNSDEMIARVDVAPETKTGHVPWNAHSWAPIIDSATSVASTLFFEEPRLRMPASIQKVFIHTSRPPSRVGYLYVKRADEAFTAHVRICDEEGYVLVSIDSMRFSEIEGTPGVSGRVEDLVHQLAWPPAQYCEQPLPMEKIILVGDKMEILDRYAESIKHSNVKSVTTLAHSDDLNNLILGPSNVLTNAVIVYIPGHISNFEYIPSASHMFAFELLNIIKIVAQYPRALKVFTLTEGVALGNSPTSLAQSALHGLSRIVASEHPDIWGGLIDLESCALPLHVMKYIRQEAAIRMSDGIPRVARLRPLPRDKLLPATQQRSLMPRREGTYLITGGFGALGLEVADFLVERGACRLILVSRRPLPPRSEWATAIATSSVFAPVIQKIRALEARGATIFTLAVDISSASGPNKLSAGIAALCLPPVFGVVHAAGVLEDQLVLSVTADSFQRVLGPKVAGALTLHTIFPPKELDFMMLFSSCGQLFGFPGQASYASANAFLDTLATHRRSQGDNTISMQWTSWRGMGMAASTEFINAELEAKGITDITRDEAFQAWEYASKYDLDQVVVLRSLELETGEPLPSPLLAEIAKWKIETSITPPSSPSASSSSRSSDTIPISTSERREYFNHRITECVAQVLRTENSEIDNKAPLSNLGIDSVMTVRLRGQLQKALGIQVPPTLTWSYPTVGHLIGWYMQKMQPL